MCSFFQVRGFRLIKKSLQRRLAEIEHERKMAHHEEPYMDRYANLAFFLMRSTAESRLSLPPPSPQGGSMCHVWKCAKCHQVHKVAASNSKLCNLIMNSFSYVLRGENFFKMGTLIVRQSFPSLCLRSAFRTTILLWRVCGITALNKLLLLKSLCYENAIW